MYNRRTAEEKDAEHKNNSLFEEAIRQLPLQPCAAFAQHSTKSRRARDALRHTIRQHEAITPITFKGANATLPAKDEHIAQRFAKSIQHHDEIILEPSLTTTHASSINGRKEERRNGIRVAALFSGGPAAGGHNVLVGLKHALGKDNTLLGVRSGPKGLLEGNLFEITNEDAARIVNTGGFDFLGSDRTKIKTPEQFAQVRRTAAAHKLDAIIIIGGDDSNTNAAFIAEYFLQISHDKQGQTANDQSADTTIGADASDTTGIVDAVKRVDAAKPVQIISVPKTMDGDVQEDDLLPISFGYDTATKIYAELAGNILQDTPSSRKYWHFIKLMGRTASHVALEVALQTRPPITLISEEIKERALSLGDIVDHIAAIVALRAAKGMNYGVVIVPEGLLESIPELSDLLERMDTIYGEQQAAIMTMPIVKRRELFAAGLSSTHSTLLSSLPEYIQEMLCTDRDAHGNLPVSQIPTERLLIDMVQARVKQLNNNIAFNTQNHFFGYEGRCGAPTAFDAMFAYNLGLTAGSLALGGHTGYMAAFTDFDSGGKPLALPLTGLLDIEEREGKKEMVIQKRVISTDSPAFEYFAMHRAVWAENDCFCSPGPRQLWGPTANQLPMTVALNRKYKGLQYTI